MHTTPGYSETSPSPPAVLNRDQWRWIQSDNLKTRMLWSPYTGHTHCAVTEGSWTKFEEGVPVEALAGPPIGSPSPGLFIPNSRRVCCWQGCGVGVKMSDSETSSDSCNYSKSDSDSNSDSQRSQASDSNSDSDSLKFENTDSRLRLLTP